MDISWSRVCIIPSTQAIGIGVYAFRQGVLLLRKVELIDESIIKREALRKLVGVVLLVGGTVSIYFGSGNIIKASTNHRIARFVFREMQDQITEKDSNDVDIYQKMCHGYDPQQILFLSVGNEVDYNQSFDPTLQYSSFRQISRFVGVRYRVIYNAFQICREIKNALEKSSFHLGVILGAHGNPRTMRWGLQTAFSVFDFLPSDCFSGLNEKAKIYLDSCNTGKNLVVFPNMAEWISWVSGREVVAATCSVASIKIITNRTESQQRLFLNNGELDIRFLAGGPDSMDCTAVFNTSTVWTEKAIFFVKVANSALVGSIITWQAMRLSATVLKGSGAAAVWFVDKSAPPIKKIAECTGCYNPTLANALYLTTRVAGKIINATGSAVHKGMDNTINWIFKKSISPISSLANTIFRRCKRQRLNLVKAEN